MGKRTVGIVAEYNPFHTGHRYHLQKSLSMTGAEQSFVIMSGSFVQRGEPALFHKFTRAEMAMRCGASCVSCLPAPFSTGGARTFAESSVAMLDKTGIVTDLVFGSENGDLEALRRAAALLAKEPPAYSAALKDYLREGLPYPRASALALKEVLG